MTTVFHGTSNENFLSIQENGFKNTKHLTSSEQRTYSTNLWIGDHGHPEAIEKAYKSAVICAALENSCSNHVSIIKMEIPDDLARGRRIEMKLGTALLNNHIKSGKITIEEVPLLYKKEFRDRYLYNTYCNSELWDGVNKQYITKELLENLSSLKTIYEGPINLNIVTFDYAVEHSWYDIKRLL